MKLLSLFTLSTDRRLDFHWDFHFFFYGLYTQGYERFMTFHYELYIRQNGDIFLWYLEM